MRRNSTDIYSVARHLGVSTTTVHYALNNTGRVSEATRRRVIEAAKQLGYRPNLLARGLRSQRSATLGVVVTSVSSFFYGLMLEGVERVAHQNQHGILLACSNDNPEWEREKIELLLDKVVDGLIVVPVDTDAGREFYTRLAADRVSMVFVDRYIPGLNVDSVATDNLQGGEMAGQHLIQSGRKLILFAATTPQERHISSIQARLAGCNAALQAAGLPPALVLEAGGPTGVPDEQFAYEVVRRRLREGVRFDGIFAVNDTRAYGAIKACLEHGLRVPEDVGVVGFDDHNMSALFPIPLTTIRQPVREIGEEAARLLLRRLESEDEQPSAQRLALVPTLIVRQSCGE